MVLCLKFHSPPLRGQKREGFGLPFLHLFPSFSPFREVLYKQLVIFVGSPKRAQVAIDAEMPMDDLRLFSFR
jgi:hypothetical protein